VTVALGYFLVQNIKEQIDDLNEKVWTVSVPIQLQDRNGKTISAGNGITDDTVLDFIPFVGTAKNMAEVGRGRDFIPDRVRPVRQR